MTKVVIYDEFSDVRATISGNDHETENVTVIAGATRSFDLAPGCVLEISHAKEPEEKRKEGPTVQEYVAAGYFARNYPPIGYESRSTQEEIDAAIAAQEAHSSPAPAASPFGAPLPDTRTDEQKAADALNPAPKTE